MTERAPKTTRLQVVAPPLTILQNSTPTVGEVPENGVVSSVSYTPNTAITGANSPASRSLILFNRGQTGVGTTEVARLDLVTGVNIAADDEKALTLSATAANLVVAAGDILEFQSNAVGGTGLVDPGGLLQVELSRF